VPRRLRGNNRELHASHEGAACRPLFHFARFIVEAGSIGYISRMISGAQRIVLVDHARLPWRFFGRLTAVQAGL
jgi:hypothetical protein